MAKTPVAGLWDRPAAQDFSFLRTGWDINTTKIEWPHFVQQVSLRGIKLYD
jgi:hypothetical protein